MVAARSEMFAVIERKVLFVSLFANASDYSNKTRIFCKIQAHIPVYASIVGVAICVREELAIRDLPNGGHHTEVYERDVTVQWGITGNNLWLM